MPTVIGDTSSVTLGLLGLVVVGVWRLASRLSALEVTVVANKAAHEAEEKSTHEALGLARESTQLALISAKERMDVHLKSIDKRFDGVENWMREISTDMKELRKGA